MKFHHCVHVGRRFRLLIGLVAGFAVTSMAGASEPPKPPAGVANSADPGWVDPFVPGTPTITQGYAMTHEHPTYGMSFGGNYAYAGPAGNYQYGGAIEYGGIMEDGLRTECGGCQILGNCDHGEWKGWLGGLLSETADMGDHSSHVGPVYNSFSHLRYSTEWIEDAFYPYEAKYRDSQMKVLVAYAMDSEGMCEQLYDANKDNGGAGEYEGGDGYPCSTGDSRETVMNQIEVIKNWVDGNSSWMEIALTGADARRIINDDKLAVVLGVEADYAFGAEDRTFDPVDRLNDYHSAGVRTVYLAHKINSRLAAADCYRSKEGDYSDAGKTIRAMQGIAGCFYYDDHIGDFPLIESIGGVPWNHCDNDWICGTDHIFGWWGGAGCNSKISEISEINTYGYVQGGTDWANGFAIYPQTPGFTGLGGTYMDGDIERNNLGGLSLWGEKVVQRAMELGMIINLDHVASQARRGIYTIATRDYWKYPLNALHNNPNEMLLPAKITYQPIWPNKNPIIKHSGASEYDFDSRERDYVRHTEGIFGVRLGPVNAAPWPTSGVTADCPATATETAKILAFLLDEGLNVGYSLDFATTTQGVASRTFVTSKNSVQGWDYTGCGDELGPDNLDTYGSAETVTEGLSHIGSMTRFHEELETIGLKERYLEKLKNNGAEQFVQMWERSNFFATYDPEEGGQR